MAQQQTQNDGWNVVATTPIPKATPPGDGWNVVSTTPAQNPIIDMSAPVAGAGALGVPQPPTQQPANMRTSILGRNAEDPDIPKGTVGQKLFGDKPVSNTGTVVGQHLKQMIAAPIHAFTDAPTSPDESAIQATQPSGALGLYRMFAKPTIDSGIASVDALKSGDYTEAAQKAMDAIPVAGPWARGFENDAKTYGALPALAGFGTDLAAPKLAGKIVAPAMKGAGSLARWASSDKASGNLAATRLFVKGSPGQLLQSALKPSVTYGAGAADMLEKGLSQVTAADPSLQGVSGFARASELARAAAAKPYTDLVSPYRQSEFSSTPPIPSSISGAPIADAQLYSMPLMDQIEQPHINVRDGKDAFTSQTAAAKNSRSSTNSLYSKTAGVADNYRDDFTVPMLDELRQNANAKLNAFYNKSGGDQAAALSNPETARVKAVGDSTRGVLYPYLEQNAGLAPGTVAGMQDNFTKMSNIEDIANKREPVYLRKDPISLAQDTSLGIGDAINPLGAASKIANWALQKKVGAITNSDALVNSAVDRFKNPSQTPLVARPGLLPALGTGFGNAAQHLTPPMIQKPLFLAPKNTTGKVNK
jgi:hypothetical protein